MPQRQNPTTKRYHNRYHHGDVVVMAESDPPNFRPSSQITSTTFSIIAGVENTNRRSRPSVSSLRNRKTRDFTKSRFRITVNTRISPSLAPILPLHFLPTLHGVLNIGRPEHQSAPKFIRESPAKSQKSLFYEFVILFSSTTRPHPPCPPTLNSLFLHPLLRALNVLQGGKGPLCM